MNTIFGLRQRLQRPKQWRALAAWLVLPLLMSIGSPNADADVSGATDPSLRSRADGIVRLHWTTWHRFFSWTEQPPPPSLRPYLPQFIPIYIAYQSIPASASKPPFSHWLIMHGVVDPTTHRAMMLLYAWAERNSF